MLDTLASPRSPGPNLKALLVRVLEVELTRDHGPWAPSDGAANLGRPPLGPSEKPARSFIAWLQLGWLGQWH